MINIKLNKIKYINRNKARNIKQLLEDGYTFEDYQFQKYNNYIVI